MRVLVTGIEGFVGSHAAEFLLKIPDVEVHGTVLDATHVPNINHIQNNLHLRALNILDGERLARFIDEIRPQRIIHLAGQAFVPTAFVDPLSTFQANIMGGTHVLEAARILKEKADLSPSVLIVSTGEVYGRVEHLPITEDFPLVPNNPYAASKAGIDLIAQQYQSAFGLSAIVVRPFNHVGPRQSPVFVCSDFAKQIAEAAAGKREQTIRVGNTQTKRDFTDVRDVVRAYWTLLDHDANGVYNVCSGRPVAVQEILDTLVRLANVKMECITERDRLRSYDIPVVYGSYEKLHNATGWTPTISLEQTLRDVYEYWLRQIT